MFASTFMQLFSQYAPVGFRSTAECEKRTTLLREAGMVRESARGLTATHLSVVEAATVFISYAGPGPGRRAVDTARLYANLSRKSPIDQDGDWLDRCETLAEVVEKVFNWREPGGRAEILQNVTMYYSWPEATVHSVDGRTISFDDGKPRPADRLGMGEQCFVRGDVLVHLAAALREDAADRANRDAEKRRSKATNVQA